MAGELLELTGQVAKKEKYTQEYKHEFYAMLLGYAKERGHNTGSAYHRYIEKFGVGPAGKKPEPKVPDIEVRNWITSRNIAKAHRRVA